MTRPSLRTRNLRYVRGSQSIHLRRQLEKAENQMAQAMHRLETILQISLKLVEACDEGEVAQLVLPVAIDLAGAKGGAFVPLDEHGQTRSVANSGEMPITDLDAWLEYLASSRIRERCSACETRNRLTSSLNSRKSCPLLTTPFGDMASNIYCFPVLRNEHEYGVISLYLPLSKTFEDQSMILLRTLIDQAGLAMEAVRIRRREQAAMQYMQTWRQKTDLDALLNGILGDVIQALEADFAVIVLLESSNYHRLIRGDLPNQAQREVDRVIESVIISGEPQLINGGGPAIRSKKPGVVSLLAAPILMTDRSAIGGLLVGSLHQQDAAPRSLMILQSMAGQVGLILQQAQSRAELEYKTIIQERTRLSREIHDGLAQTLAFLKLQTVQMQKYLAQQDQMKLQQSLSVSYTALSEAYEEARLAIDELRIELNGKGLAGWLEQVLSDFKEASGIDIRIEPFQIFRELSPEVHAQLIRIVQEALNNIRKHTRADEVWVSCWEDEEDLVMEIRDNGIGFTYEDVPSSARHGLQGMRERAELIGADLQVLSRPNEGTIVRLKLPREALRAKGLPG